MNRTIALLRTIFLAAGVFCLSSCYVTVQGTRYLALRSKAVSAERALADPKTSAATKNLLSRAAKIRSFATNVLGLKDTRNYKAVVEMDADRLATIVSACDAVSFERYLWRYPVVGALPYKGFFKPEEAEREAARLKAKGLDVIVRPVDAFSTLGWFADPLFSFMSSYDDAELAETLIHELSHATVFVKKAEQFNEEFATFVGRRGALAYLEAAYGPKSRELEEAIETRRDSETFAAFLRETADALEPVYGSSRSREEKLARKKEILASRAEEYSRIAPSAFKGEGYRDFPMERINNAYLDLYRLYEGEPELYREYLDRKCGGNLSRFIKSVADLAASGGDPKERMRNLLGTGG